MPKGTISYRIASEVAGIEVAGVRYRATRSTRLPATDVDGPPSSATATWTLWHDDREGGAHTVGYSHAHTALDEAIEAAVQHEHHCDR